MDWWLNKKHLFLTVLEAGRSNMKALANLVPGENSLPRQTLQINVSHFTLTRQKQKDKLPWSLLITSQSHLWGLLFHDLKVPPSDTITLEIMISTYEFWGNTNIQCIRTPYFISGKLKIPGDWIKTNLIVPWIPHIDHVLYFIEDRYFILRPCHQQNILIHWCCKL